MKQDAPDTINENGYYDKVRLSKEELESMREIIENHYFDIIETYSLEVKEKINNYHKAFLNFNHGSFWSKDKRILKRDNVLRIQNMPFYKQLKQLFGDFNISNEENIEKEELYFRICRPYEPLDFGPMHADCWFWDLGHGEIPKHKKRIKVWIAVFTENGLNGLRYVPNSHKENIPYKGIKKEGFKFPKPQIITKEEDLNILLFECEPGSVIVFHDKLLHGGAPNYGKYTRISLEFTILVDKN